MRSWNMEILRANNIVRNFIMENFHLMQGNQLSSVLDLLQRLYPPLRNQHQKVYEKWPKVPY